jgi:hypothetical protein
MYGVSTWFIHVDRRDEREKEREIEKRERENKRIFLVEIGTKMCKLTIESLFHTLQCLLSVSAACPGSGALSTLSLSLSLPLCFNTVQRNR